ncbi:plasmid mobilization protein [Lachnospiraceae bacterium]
MSGTHKYPTISFRISPREREEIEAKILASGMSKKDYFVRSCIYNRVCVVGRKELIYQLMEELKIMQTNIREVTEQFEQAEVTLSAEGLQDMRNDCLDMLKAILWMLDGARYLWQGEEKSPDSGNC